MGAAICRWLASRTPRTHVGPHAQRSRISQLGCAESRSLAQRHELGAPTVRIGGRARSGHFGRLDAPQYPQQPNGSLLIDTSAWPVAVPYVPVQSSRKVAHAVRGIETSVPDVPLEPDHAPSGTEEATHDVAPVLVHVRVV